MLGFTNFTSIRLDSQIQVSTQSVIPQHGMQPNQVVLSLLKFCPGHWHPDTTELMDGCLPDALSYYKVVEEKKEEKRKEKTWDLDEAPLFLRSIHVREQKTCQKTQMTHCFRDTQPSKAGWFKQLWTSPWASKSPILQCPANPTFPFLPLLAQTSSSCGIWGQEFHQLKIT